ncbi:e9872538-c8d9-44d7-aa47-b24611692c11 [Thermothielavioides terrestris]|uniref:E9872538-c8d9-44d7-aa47-b24611692c11 n=1 Tax=Thermothielavioides terrestris TaxID=2587410 RepID=A0A446BLP6_9PEZI|nr:e9872538-c8d9-44d7-aa47-b24611692c11 [Thermothielavioides terrestris]
MDNDQFGGRTDDDLFSDDIEPVEEVISVSVPDQPVPHDAPPQPQEQPASAPATAAQQPPATSTATSAPKSLAQSRHNPSRRPDKSSRPSNNNRNTNGGSENASAPQSEPAASTTTPAQNPPPSAPREPSSSARQRHNANNSSNPTTSSTPSSNSSNTASVTSSARLNSGANPRTKLTDEELAARMEKMRLLAAEKTRRFEEAQRDESEHAAAYALGMEEARRRRAAEAERRRAADEARRRMDEERARNRERKLKAIGLKEGGWDAGKLSQDGDPADAGRGASSFRGAFGGVRGARGAGRAHGDRPGDLGAGRGRDAEQARPGPAPEKKPELKAEDFPALPSSTAAPKKIETTWVAKPGAVADLPVSPPVGKWDEEMAAVDAKQASS